MTEPINVNSTTSLLETPAYETFKFSTNRLKNFIDLMSRGFKGISQETILTLIESIPSAPNALEQKLQ